MLGITITFLVRSQLSVYAFKKLTVQTDCGMVCRCLSFLRPHQNCEKTGLGRCLCSPCSGMGSAQVHLVRERTLTHVPGAQYRSNYSNVSL